jgi:hypothetical protein
MERHIGQKVRRSGGRTKGPAKRTKEDNERFEAVFAQILYRQLADNEIRDEKRNQTIIEGGKRTVD